MEKVKIIQEEVNRQMWFWFQALCGVFAGLLILGQLPAAAKQSPTIRLFPTTVVENIKQTGQAAKAMEQDLQSVIDRLNEQEALYVASKCEGAGAEQGCNDIANWVKPIWKC